MTLSWARQLEGLWGYLHYAKEVPEQRHRRAESVLGRAAWGVRGFRTAVERKRLVVLGGPECDR